MLPRRTIQPFSFRKPFFLLNVTREIRVSRATAPYKPCASNSLGLNGLRAFSQTKFLFKSASKSGGKSPSTKASNSVDDPYDFSALETGIRKALEKLTGDLSKLRTGGRFNPELLEAVKVHLSKDSKISVRLGELAQVLPKGGRNVVVLIGEAAHVKPVISAIQGSKELNLQPQQDGQNPCQLNVPIPPPTKESRDQALVAANKAGEMASVAIRNARSATQKKLRAIELKKAARPDDLKKAHKEMEKIVEKGNADAKKAVDAAKKTMEYS